MILYPDTADGTLVGMTQAYRGERGEPSIQFAAFFDPDSAEVWIARARAFLEITLPATDTNRVVLSRSLIGPRGAEMYFARRRSDSGWTSARYLGLRQRAERPVMYINLPPQIAATFLDSLTAVVLRTPLLQIANRSRLMTTADPTDTADCPLLLPPSRGPQYPSSERGRGIEGGAWASFVVTDRGEVDKTTLEIIASTSAGFARSVREAVPRFRFDPARRDGVAFPQRVVMPFTFQLTGPWDPPIGQSKKPPARCM